MSNLQTNRVSPIRTAHAQGTPEWHRVRLGNVTGSETENTYLDISQAAQYSAIRELLGVKSITAKVKETQEFLDLFKMNPFELFEKAEMKPPESAKRELYRKTRVAERITGLPSNPEGIFATYAMKWGVANESLAIAKYKMKTGNIVKPAPFLLHPTLRVGASPDGEVIERYTGLVGVLEVKCLATHNHLYDIIKGKEVPERFLVQIHTEMWISGTDFCDFVGFDPRLPGKLEIFIKRVHRDDKYLDETLIPNVTRFLDEVDREERYFRMMSRISKEQEKLLYGKKEALNV